MITFMWSQEGNKEMLEIIPLLKKCAGRDDQQALLMTSLMTSLGDLPGR